MALFKNTITGEEIEAPDHYLGHPILGAYLLPLDADADKADAKNNKTKGTSLGTSTENNEE